MKREPSQVGTNDGRKSGPAQSKTSLQGGADEALLAAFQHALGAELAASVESAARQAGMPLAHFLMESAEQCAADAAQLARACPGVRARLFKVPVDEELSRQLVAASSALGIPEHDLVCRALAEVVTRPATATATPAPASGSQGQVTGQGTGNGGGEPVSIRCLSTADSLEMAKCQREGSESGQLAIQTFGLLGPSAFDDGRLLDYVFQVVDEHRDYLKRVVVPQLPDHYQVQVLEMIHYAQEWGHQKAVSGGMDKIKDPLCVETLPGLAGRLAVSHKDLFQRTAALLTRMSVVALLEKHFVRGSGPLQSVIEWGEVLEIAWMASGCNWQADAEADESLDDIRCAAKARALCVGEGRRNEAR